LSYLSITKSIEKYLHSASYEKHAIDGTLAKTQGKDKTMKKTKTIKK